ncbi:MAG: T9SS type A sorting domain-containing protein [Candidatus Kryptoniota bacterium]
MSKITTAMLCFFMAAVAFSQTQLPRTLSGSVSGTTLPNRTYIVKDSISINAGDTLQISAGDTIIMANPYGWIHVLGALICDGTKTSPNLITVPVAQRTGPGQWGGIYGDSCNYFEMRWTTILWAGGNNPAGHAYRTVDIYSNFANTTTTVFTDNTVIGTVDDCIGLHGGNASILRNTIKWCGAPDGDNINIKAGTIGEVAYNVIWGSGGNGIKINADVTLPRLTNMCVHNNTIVAGGWRRVGELGYAILVDASARAEIYNNIMGDMYQELEITTKADTLRTVYDNNLFFYSIDSLGGSARYFPSDGVTKQAPHDIVGVQASALFASYNAYFNNDWFALDGSNDYHLLPGSQGLGTGFTPPSSWVNPYFTGNLPGDPNMGALGVYVVTKVKSQSNTIPTTFGLNQNYPNPFNPTTMISYQLPVNIHVTLKVYDILGREVASLVDGDQTAGVHEVQFSAQNLATGVYFYRLSTPEQNFVKKMLLVK